MPGIVPAANEKDPEVLARAIRHLAETGFDLSILTAVAALATDDTFPFYDTSTTLNGKVTLSDLFRAINVLTADATPDSSADYLMTYDASADLPKKVLINNLPFHGVKVYLGSNQALAAFAGTFTVINLDTEVFDTDNAFDSSAHTWTPSSGKWLCTMTMIGLSATDLTIFVERNNTNSGEASDRLVGVDTSGTFVKFTTLLSANGSDVFRFRAFSVGGHTLSGQTGSVMSAYRVGA